MSAESREAAAMLDGWTCAWCEYRYPKPEEGAEGLPRYTTTEGAWICAECATDFLHAREEA